MMWMNGTNVNIELTSPAGPLLSGSLPLMTHIAAFSPDRGELVRFTYELTDPETGETIRGAARLLLESVPDPRDVPPAPREENRG